MFQVLNHLHTSSVLSPFERRTIVLDVPDIEPGASFDEHPNRFEMPGESSLVQGRRVCMGSHGVLTVRIFTGIEQ